MPVKGKIKVCIYNMHRYSPMLLYAASFSNKGQLLILITAYRMFLTYTYTDSRHYTLVVCMLVFFFNKILFLCTICNCLSCL